MKKLLLALFIFSSVSLMAQQTVTVEVYDLLTNEALSGLTVTLSQAERNISVVETTDERGRASFRALPALDDYQVMVAENDTYLEGQSGQFDLRNNQDRTVQLQLFTKRSVEIGTVTVGATNGAARINRTDAEVAFELSRSELAALPIEGRDITQVLYRLPNVSRATGFYPEAPNVSINGANSLFTSYLIDGLDNNERFLGGQKFAIPTGFTKNVAVLTNNYSAEYGLTANGVINITTRSGSNDFSGEAFLLSRPGTGFLDSPSPFGLRDLSGNVVNDDFRRYQGGAAFGGAITRDKTFYYFDFEHTTDQKENLLNSPGLGINTTVPGTNQFTYLSGKLDHNWNSRWRTALRANVGKVAIERQGGGLDGGVVFPSAGNAQSRNSTLVAINNTYVGEQFSMQTNAQYARFNWNYAQPFSDASPQVTVLGPDELPLAVLGHPGFAFNQVENTLQLQQKFTLYRNNHTLKAGGGIISADHQLFGGGVPLGAYRVRLTADQLNALQEQGLGADLSVNDIPRDVQVLDYRVELRPASFGTRQSIFSLYLEDQWAATNRLNLTLGLRYDYDNLSRGGSDRGDFNNLAPRLNFNYKLGSRSSLRGGYGVFYEKILYAVYSDALQQNTTSADYRAQLQEFVDLGILPSDTDLDRITFDGNLTGFSTNVAYLDGPTGAELSSQRENVFSGERRILNPSGYQNPYTHQLALGYQLQVNEQSLFFVDLVHNRSHNLFRLRNLNAAASYPLTDPNNVRVRTLAEADATRPVAIVDGSYAIIDGQRVDGVARNVVVSETAGESRYYAASLNYQRDRGESSIAYRFNYTLSLLENNTEDINFRAMDANNFAAEWGPSINDRRHILNAIGTYYAPFGLQATLAALVQSGQPINRIPDALLYGTTDLNGDGASFGDAYVGNSDRYPGVDRNSDRLPWAYNFDLGLQYPIAIGGNELAIRVDVFNLLNTQNWSGYSNNATQSNQIQVGPAGGEIVRRNADQPRQFQFSLNYLF